jgi:hypothetical protein
VVVRDFDIVGISILPPETDPILVVDPNTVLTRAVATQAFQAIAWGNIQFAEFPHAVDLGEFTPHGRPNPRGASLARPTTVYTIEEVFGSAIREGTYHGKYYNGQRDSLPELSATKCRHTRGSGYPGLVHNFGDRILEPLLERIPPWPGLRALLFPVFHTTAPIAATGAATCFLKKATARPTADS